MVLFFKKELLPSLNGELGSYPQNDGVFRRFPLLLSFEALGPAYQWRLVDSFYENWRPPVEGCGAIAIVAALALARAGGRDFAATIVASLLMLAARMLHRRQYLRRSAAGRQLLGSPEAWTRQFMGMSLATAYLWCVLDFGGVRTGDISLQIVIITVQSGWLGAACTRNAASPATVFWQASLVLVPAVLCMPISRDAFILALAPFACIQFSACLGIARNTGRQIIGAMISEQELEAANARLMALSATDGLTGIANRRAFDAALLAEWSRAARDAADLGLLMIDVDHFKAFNDRYGHPAGDECLRMVAESIAACLRRPPDLAARFGGEEFVALLPATSATEAVEVGERVRAAIMGAAIRHEGSALGCVTVSIGAATISPHPGDDAQGLINLADRALYDAKRMGRNQVRCATEGLGLGVWDGSLLGVGNAPQSPSRDYAPEP